MKKLLSFLLIAMMAVTLCSAASAESAGIDFEDGLCTFASALAYRGNADASVLLVVEFHGSKALKAESQGKVPYIALNLDGLLGENLPKVRSIQMELGIDEGPDGKFYAVSGLFYLLTGTDSVESIRQCSVYMDKKNLRTFTITLEDSEVFEAGSGNSLIISKNVDNYASKHSATPLPF